MALALFDRVQETTTTTGTGSVTLGGAVPGFQSFAVVGNGNTCYYTIVDGTAWEVGVGTYSTSGPTLARTTVLSNSSGNTSPITLAAGTKSIFLTYPAEKSVNLDGSNNVSPLGTVSSGVWQGSTVGVAYGGTGVTASSGANSVMLRDANQNVSINRLNQTSNTITASGGTTTLTAASAFSQILNGTGGQTFKLPDATTLTNTTTFEFNNNATGTLTITDYANATIGTVSSGGAAAIALLSNGTVGGTWDVHAYIPESVTWGTNSLVLGGTVITGGTWNGGTIATGYGGTGLTTYTSGGAVYANSASTLTSGTLPVTAGGTGNTTGNSATTSQTNFSNLTIGGSQVLYAGNYNSYAPTLTGTGATGTWGINVSGNAATATSATTATNQSGGTVNATTGAFSGKVTMSNGGVGVAAASTLNVSGDITSSRAANQGVIYLGTNGTSYLYADGSGNYILGTGSTTLSLNGNQVLTAGNYNSYAPTLTGTGATGTWGINISGNAATATNGLTTVNYNSYAPTLTGTGASGTWGIRVTGFANAGTPRLYASDSPYTYDGAAPYYMYMTYDGSRWLLQVSPASPSAVRVAYADAAGSATTAVTLTSTQSNWNSTGVISNVVGMLAWKNYGNSHVIFDASAGTSPSGTSVNNTNSQIAWAGSYPTLMGWNGANTYGVRVDSARVADSAGSAGSSSAVSATTSTGIQTNYLASIDTTTPGLTNYGIAFSGSSIADYAAGITWGWSGTNAQAGIYVQSSGSYGTKMYFGTTDSFATGSKTSMSIDHTGVVQTLRNYFQAAGSSRAPIFYDSNDTTYYVDPNSTSYVLQMRIGATASTTLAALTVSQGNGVATLYRDIDLKGNWAGGEGHAITANHGTGATDIVGQMVFQHDGPGSRIKWGRLYASGNQSTYPMELISEGSGGSAYLQMNTGSMRAPLFYDYDNTAYYVDPASTSTLQAISSVGVDQAYSARYDVSSSSWSARIVSRNYTTNVAAFLGNYNGYAGLFGHSAALDAWGPIYINAFGGTSQANVYLGNMYSPIFYDLNDTAYYLNPNGGSYLSSLVLSGAAYFRPNTWIQLDGDYGIYSAAYNSAHFLANISSTYTQWRIIGSRNSYGGIYDTHSAVNGMMYDSSGNGGVYREANGRWYFYYNIGADCMGIGTANASSTYSLYLNKGVYAQSRIDAPIFYDTNDTTFYVDPNSRSELKSLDLGYTSGTVYDTPTTGVLFFNNHNESDIQGYSIGTTLENIGGNYTKLTIDWHTGIKIGAYYGYGGIRFFNNSVKYYSGTEIFSIAKSDNAVRVYTDIRSPIFYDLDNTAYYVDPTSASNFGGDIIRSNISQGNIYLTGTLPGYGANTYPTLRTDGAVLYFAAAGVYSGYWSTYDFVSRGNVTAYSDETLKTNWRDLPERFVEKLSTVKHGVYDRIDTGLTQEGVSAQSIRPLLPNSVLEGVDGKLTLNYGSAALVSAVELAKYVTALEQRISQLEARL